MNNENKKPEISVVMSVWDDEKFLKDSVESILKQGLDDFEFIIIDDYSTDHSWNILKDFEARDKRIKLIKNSEHVGLTKSLNKGLKFAKGKYIARMDADDVSLPQRFLTQYEFLEKNKDIFLCGTEFIFIDASGEKIDFDKRRLPHKQEEIESELKQRNCFVHPSLMFRSDGTLYREKMYYSQDYDLVLMLLSAGKKMANLDKKLLLFRKDMESGLSYLNRGCQKLFAKKAREFYLQRERRGSDDYNNFMQEEILKFDNGGNGEIVAMKDELLSLLKQGKRSEARLFFAESLKGNKGLRFHTKMILGVFANCPFVYKVYRKIFYGE